MFKGYSVFQHNLCLRLVQGICNFQQWGFLHISFKFKKKKNNNNRTHAYSELIYNKNPKAVEYIFDMRDLI